MGKAIWQSGSSQLYEFAQKGKPVLFIPSLINKPTILHLSKKHSLLLRLVRLGFKPYLLDWGIPGHDETGYSIDSYIHRLLSCLEFLGKTHVAGYCMGGQLLLAAARLRPELIDRIVTIATPWDFSQFKLPRNPGWTGFLDTIPDPVPASFIQQLFYHASPLDVNRKFIKLSLGHIDLNDFFLIENWVNDGVPIARKVLFKCIDGFLKKNELLRGLWQVDGVNIEPRLINHHTMCVVAGNDKIAPKASCEALYYRIRNSRLVSINSGHIGMIINPKYELAEAIGRFLLLSAT